MGFVAARFVVNEGLTNSRIHRINLTHAFIPIFTHHKQPKGTCLTV